MRVPHLCILVNPDFNPHLPVDMVHVVAFCLSHPLPPRLLALFPLAEENALAVSSSRVPCQQSVLSGDDELLEGQYVHSGSGVTTRIGICDKLHSGHLGARGLGQDVKSSTKLSSILGTRFQPTYTS